MKNKIKRHKAKRNFIDALYYWTVVGMMWAGFPLLMIAYALLV